ncbi:secreted RxLR effector protein 161-like [Lactuca sativa]|uniref:secreted RxLR effector protein 161-like n=1 Tax=Lactuca sativa TaxID=4236 RepID=UPI001C68FC52|nr:secreted RxLR effector protein 161-like [Lactuca sativa]
MAHGIVLSSSQCPCTKAELDKMKDIPYASGIGFVMYAMNCTRPDLAYAISMVSKFQQNPGESHWRAVKNILKYLRRTNDLFLVYGCVEESLSVKCYTDASFTTYRDDCKLQLGYVFIINGGVVSWKSSKQSVVAQSTIESEYIAASEAAQEAAWMKKFIRDLGVVPTIQDPLDVFYDNEGATTLAKEP